MKITITGDLMEGVFINRINRFLAEISIDGVIHHAHVPNTGRMKEFLIPGAKVILRKIIQEHRKTIFDLLMAYDHETLINIDSKLPNSLLEKAFKEKVFPLFENYGTVKREVRFGSSRFDFVLSGNESFAFIEAKCVTYVDEKHTASFPDAPTERGRKHVMELVEVVKEGMRGVVIFVIQREDAHRFTPNTTRDPFFSKAMKEAHAAGVEFYAITCKLTPQDITLNKLVPIIYDLDETGKLL